jgi:hypothetical protein
MPATPARRVDQVPIQMLAATPQHQRLFEQTAIERLLKAAIEEDFSETEDPEKISARIDQFHALIKTLVSECIVGLVDMHGNFLNEALLLQVPHILTLLESRCGALPVILLSEPKTPEGPIGFQVKISLYRWLVPRLLVAASGLAFHSTGQEVGEKILQTVIKIIRILGGHLKEEGFMAEGVVYCVELLRGLSESCAGTSQPDHNIHKTAMLSLTSPHN